LPIAICLKENTMTKKEVTGKKAASAASTVLRNKYASKTAKSAAGSALS